MRSNDLNADPGQIKGELEVKGHSWSAKTKETKTQIYQKLKCTKLQDHITLAVNFKKSYSIIEELKTFVVLVYMVLTFPFCSRFSTNTSGYLVIVNSP